MQKKTISKKIRTQIEAWLSTIEDKELVKDLRDNIIVSGGSIASMFLKEPVNDYDVYIMDMDVLYRLTIYYTKPFDSLIVLDGREKESLMKKHGDADDQFGIAVRNLKPDQIRIFVDGDRGGYRVDQVEQSSEDKEQKKYRPLFFSPNAISLSDDLQIVVRFNGEPSEIHKNYDFIPATNYFTLKDGVVTNIEAMESLLTRQLVYQGSLYPVTSIIRVRKFIKRNWNIGAGELLKIMFQISELNLNDIEVLEEQLVGVDVAYFEALIKALRNKKKNDPDFVIDKTYLGRLIDKIFSEESEESLS